MKFGLVCSLEDTVSLKTRMAIVSGIFRDAASDDVPHQWERKKDYICGPNDDCGQPGPGKTCFRDTSEEGSCFAVPSKLAGF